jgi:hypothetical protein
MPIIGAKGSPSSGGFGQFAQAATSANYIEDVFSTWLYTGNGSTQTITNGIDLAGKGGLVWVKNRSSAYDNVLVDSALGPTADVLFSNTTNANLGVTYISAFNSNGFSVATNVRVNESAAAMVSWTFRKQPKFFDVVTWTGDGASNRAIAHSLNGTVGAIHVKSTSSVMDWKAWHRSNSFLAGTAATADCILALNSTGGNNDLYNELVYFPTLPTTTNFYVGSANNSAGVTYVAYLFAHDSGGFGLTGTDNVISCGSYTGNGSTTGPVIDLGYEPQWLLIKRTDSSPFDWYVMDTMRGIGGLSGQTKALYPNLSDAEGGLGPINVLATGFQPAQSFTAYNASGGNYIYIAIRRGPMKVPESGTEVFDPEAYTGTSATRTITSGFPVDLSISKIRSQGFPGGWFDRLRGALQVIRSSNTDPEVTSPDSLTGFDSNTGVVLGGGGGGRINTSPDTYAMWNFRRAPGFFDEVCYTGNDTAGRTVTHNLGVVPEIIIVKSRTSALRWAVYSAATGNNKGLILNTTAASTTISFWGNTTPTASVFTVDGGSETNQAGNTYVAYLFATCPGVSKVGSYTGNGTTQAIACGFTGGARFVLIKRTDATGDWYVYDTARGMTMLTDPYLLLNSDAAETATLGSVITSTGGFTVNAAILAAINTNAASYVFLAIA